MKHALLRTWRALVSRWYLVLLVVAIDIAFLYFFGRTYAGIFQQISTHLNTINALLQQSIGTFAQSNDATALELGMAQFNAEVAFVESTILQVIAYLAGYWLVCEGIAWYFVYRIADVKTRVVDFAWRFALATVAGLALFVGWISLIVWLSVKTFSSPVPLIGQSELNLIAAIGGLVLAYLLLVAYSVLEKGFWKKFSRAAFKRITTTGLAYVLGLVVLFVLAKLLGVIFATRNILLAFAFAVIILLPAMTALRVFLIEIIKEN
ncbi:MAG TPA: hypothetical protein VLJ21_00370 [Candidatus Binatia bacterium]|nr:hypothetical protein [Candidatus Binatia bacterium]